MQKLLFTLKKSDIQYLFRELEFEKQKSDSLLVNILPKNVANELKETGKVEPVSYDCATVMFTDFENFTTLSKILSPAELVQELDICFNAFDKITGRFKLEIIKTIGDGYMCVGGIPNANKTHAIDAILAAFDFLLYIENRKRFKENQNLPFFNVRIGINTGNIIAGVIGSKKSSYDVWGDTVNLASRLESAGKSGKINISEATYNLVKDFFDCSYRGEIEVKNAGKLHMYFVNSIKTEFSLFNNAYIPNDKFHEYYKKYSSI